MIEDELLGENKIKNEFLLTCRTEILILAHENRHFTTGINSFFPTQSKQGRGFVQSNRLCI
jgi:hypothetical protein